MTVAADWQARVGDAWAREWRQTDRSFAALSPHLDAAIVGAAPERGRALDIGCGAGGTSVALALARPDLAITGIDLSEGLVTVARERAAGVPNVRFTVGDAASSRDMATDAVGGPFDLLCSRHGVMFFAEPRAAFAALRSRAAPGAPFVFSCFREIARNPFAAELIAAITGAAPVLPAGYAPGPFGLADRDATAAILAAAGWGEAEARSIEYDYVAGAGDDPVGDALHFFSNIGPAASVLAAAPAADRPTLLRRLRAALTERVVGDTVTFPAAAWIWTARAAKEPA